MRVWGYVRIYFLTSHLGCKWVEGLIFAGIWPCSYILVSKMFYFGGCTICINLGISHVFFSFQSPPCCSRFGASIMERRLIR